jgi:hypothetical protein
MGDIGPIDKDSAEQILTLLHSLPQPLTEADARALVADKGWHIDGDIPGEGLIASGDWPGGDEAILFGFDSNGETPNFTITAYAAPATDPVALPTAVDTFAMLVHLATAMFGMRNGEIIAEYPRAWWILPGQTISISRGANSATIMWATHADHHDLIASATQEQP